MFLIALLALGASACSTRSSPRSSQEPFSPTPFRLNVPAWAVDTAHPINIPYDNPLTVEGIALGRRLFYEKALSSDGSLSCASCHQQAHAFADPRTSSPGIGGAIGTRNAQPLFNLAWDHFFFWDARALSVEMQAFEPVTGHREMGSDWNTVARQLSAITLYPPLFRAAFGDERIDSMRVAFALAQFERTLVSLDSRFDRYFHEQDTDALTTQDLRGKDLFFTRAHCADCHEPPFFNGHSVSNIGLDAEPIDRGMGARTGIPWHMGRFKTPSLRNIEATAPYMHDGRFATLDAVVDFYADDVRTASPTLDDHMQPWVRGEIRLSAQDRADLVAFLKTLTDTAFLRDTTFSEPR